jgi:hypothetical protein
VRACSEDERIKEASGGEVRKGDRWWGGRVEGTGGVFLGLG